MTRGARKIGEWPATPEVLAVVEKHRQLLKQKGIKVVDQGHALITEAGARRWILVLPDKTVTEHASEKQALKAADQWSQDQIGDATKTVGVLKTDVRRRPKRRKA